eukprot:jgi/Mesvir1/15280/Mv06498-RA.1
MAAKCGTMADYLVVLHIEATGEAAKGPREVAGMYWNVVDYSSGQVVDQKQLHCKPEWSTSSDPMAANAELRLRDIISQFDAYFNEQFPSLGGRTACIVASSSCILTHILRPEAAAKGIPLGAHFSSCLDIVDEFRNCFGQTVAHLPRGLNYALAYLQLAADEFANACNETTQVALRLRENGYKFLVPRPSDEVDEASLAAANAAVVMAHTSHTTSSAATNVVRLRGLPWQATEKDVVEFFKGLAIPDGNVLLCLNFQGKPTGEAYVKFASVADASAALQKSRSNMGHRYIEVFSCTSQDMESATRLSAAKGGAMTGAYGGRTMGVGGNPDMRYQGVVRARGLPYSASVADVSEFFRGYDIVSDGIFMVTSPDGRPTGEVFVEFVSEDVARGAMSRHREKLGARYLELFRSSKGEMMLAGQQSAHARPFGMYGGAPGGGHMGAGVAGILGGAHPHHPLPHMFMGMGAGAGGIPGGQGGNVCVKMRGLPYSATQMDIMQFFQGFSLGPGGVHVCTSSKWGMSGGMDERPTGEAFVEFVSAEEAAAAISKLNKRNIGSRYVELFPASKADMLLARGGGAQGLGGGLGMVGGMDAGMLMLLQQQQAQAPQHHLQQQQQQQVGL